MVLEGCPEATEVGDRAEAILRGVDALEPGDALLICRQGARDGADRGLHRLPLRRRGTGERRGRGARRAAGMSALWTAAEAAAATGGEARGDWAATGVSIDTRSLAQGDLFVALKDARDGHDFVEDALAGARPRRWSPACRTAWPPTRRSSSCRTCSPRSRRWDAPGARARGRGSSAITGSVGKTSTKDMLRFVLTGQGKVHAAEKSFNNHWGVPLTLARLPRDADFAVIEIGMNHPGEIAPLSRMARPHVAIVTTVGAAHLEAFGSLEGIAWEKAAIFEGLETGGTAIYHGDLPQTPILEEVARRHAARLIRFGTEAGNHHRAIDLRVQDDATVATAGSGGRRWPTASAAPENTSRSTRWRCLLPWARLAPTGRARSSRCRPGSPPTGAASASASGSTSPTST
jgi:UDP-N-acetylmuramyl tripeptide synthase